jgi:hypothetical protein
MRCPLSIVLSVFALSAAGCSVYRFRSPDFPAKVSLPAPAFPAAEGGDADAFPETARFSVEKVRGRIAGGAVGKSSITPDALNHALSTYWPELFAEGSSGTDGQAIPITVELGGELPFYGNCGGMPGDLAAEVSLMLFLGVIRSENKGSVTARILVGDAVWSDEAKASGQCNMAICCQPLLLPVAYPILQAIPPYGSDWPQDAHFGSIAYANADLQQRIATDLAAVAVARAASGLLPGQIADLRNKALFTKEQIADQKRLSEGSRTRTAIGDGSSGDGATVVWAESEHEFKADGRLPTRSIPEILEQRYDIHTRRGFVRANVAGCDPEEAYRYLTGRLIPAICETKNVVLDLETPPPAHALYRTLKEERGHGSEIFSIEFEALQ